MDIRPLQNEADYEAMLSRVDGLMNAEPGTREGDELEVLTMLIERYEQKHHSIEAPDPVEFLKNTMEFRGIGQNGLALVLGSRSRASEILNRRRPLTLDQIRKITSAWQVPSDALIGQYEVAGEGVLRDQ